MKFVRLVQTVQLFVKHAPQSKQRLLLVAEPATCTFQPCQIYTNDFPPYKFRRSTAIIIVKGKVHPCTGSVQAVRPIRGVEV